MIKLLNKTKMSALALFGLVLFTFSAVAQPTTLVNTTHTYNNSSSHVTFNVQNTNPYSIVITEFRAHSLSAGATTAVLYRTVPVYNYGTWSSGVIGAGQNGWILAGNGTTATTGAVTPYLSGANLVTIPAGETYQFCVSSTSTGYMTLTAGSVNTFSAGGVNILTGDGISWGGANVVSTPATPVNYPRGFVGGISFVQGIPLLPADAGITGFVNPLIPTCTFNDSISVTLKNFGTDTLTSASIGYQKNSTVYSPILWTGSLAPTQSTTVFVGTVSYTAGDNLKAWTSLPNLTTEAATGALNDTASLINLTTGLSGSYTVGGSAPDFPDIATAISVLTSAGICGPTVFNIRTGTYYEQFEMSGVTGMNATNTVTIRSEAGHRDSVVYDFSPTLTTNNYTARLNGADYYILEHMTLRNSAPTYGRALVVEGGSDHNQFTDLLVHTVISNTTSNNIAALYSSGSNDNYNTFDGCTFRGGGYGAYWLGAGTTSLEAGTTFSNSEFENNYYMGLYSWYQTGSSYSRNHVFGNSTYTSRYGMYLGYNQNGIQVNYNNIEGNATSYFYIGMYIYYSDATPTNNGLITNNSIAVGNASTSASTLYGLYHYYSGFNNVYNNSVNVNGGSATARAAYFYAGGANNVKNNNFVTSGLGYAMYLYGAYTFNSSDNNNYKTNGTSPFYYNANIATLSAWQAALSQDANSIMVDPGYYSEFDLHVCSDSLNGMGAVVALVTDDMDGQPRNATTPDIGSDEFAPLTQAGFLGTDLVICTGDSLVLSAGAPADAILWSTNDTTTTTVVTTPGSYNVSVIGACGVSFDTIVVNQSNLSYAGFLVADTTVFCSGGSVLLTSSMMADTYSWTGGSTNDSLIVTVGGPVTLNIEDACGTGTQTILIVENAAPSASFTANASYLSGIFTNTSASPATGTTYSWDFGDGTTSTEASPSHVYPSAGTYTITLTVTNDCGTSSVSVEFNTNLGLDEIAGLGTIAVYPNPSNGLFNVDFNLNSELNATVKVTNVLGETVYAKALGTINGLNNSAIDMTTAAPGIYYVTVLSNDKTVYNNMLVKN